MKLRTLILSTLIFLLIATVGILLPARHSLSLPLGLWSPSRPTAGAAADQANTSKDLGGKIKLLLVTEQEDGFGLQAQPVDPTTLAVLPHAAPINLGAQYAYATSPDRQTLAVITWPSSSAIN